MIQKVRAASSRVAGLGDSEILDLVSNRALLGPGELMLSYSLGAESRVFAITREGLDVISLNIDTTALRGQVDGFLAEAGKTAGPGPKAIIAPHAGYIYSGSTAAAVYASLAKAKTVTSRVLIIFNVCSRTISRSLELCMASCS